MPLTRRRMIQLGLGGTAAAALQIQPALAASHSSEIQTAIDAFAEGTTVAEGRITLITPEIAENGNTVPVEFTVDSPMTDEDHVTSVTVLADGNPATGVATFHFAPINGQATAKTRIRLSQTQNVYALAKMSDGSVFMASNNVKVTIGGCGG